MAITLVTLSGTVADLVGDVVLDDNTTNPNRRVKVVIDSNAPGDYIADLDNEVMRLGTATVTPAADGTWSFANLIATGSADTNLDDSANLQYTVRVDYPRASDRKRVQESFGPFAVTTTSDVTALVAEQALDLSYASEFMTQAQALLDAQIVLSTIDDTDSAVGALIADPVTLGPLTGAALSAAIDARVPAASTTTPGKVELATTAETTTATDTARAVTPVTARALVDQIVHRGAGLTVLGDSIAAFNTAGANSWHRVWSTLTGQKLRWRGTFSTGGYSLEQIESTHLPQVLALSPKPGACVIAGGANNVGSVSYNATTSKATLLRIADALDKVGIKPVLWTLPPRDDDTTVNANVQLWNVWLRYESQRRDWPLIDAHSALVDPATGLYQTALKLDAVHPSTAGHYAIGAKAAADTALVARFHDDRPYLTKAVLDAANLVASGYGIFTSGANGNGIPTGWNGFGIPSAATASFTAATDPAVGNWLKLAKATGLASTGGVRYDKTTGFSVGDKIAVSCRCRNITGMPDSGTPVGGSAFIAARAAGVQLSGSAIFGAGGTWEGIGYTELVVPATTDTLRIEYSISGTPAADASLEIAQVTMLNLTTLGLA